MENDIQEIAIPADVRTGILTAMQLVATADDYLIDSDLVYTGADDVLAAVVGRKKALVEQRMEMTRPLDRTKKAIMNLFADPISKLEAAERALKAKMLSYMADKEQARRKAEAQAQEIARKERERLEKRAQAAADKGKVEQAEALQEAADSIQAPVRVVAKPESNAVIKTTYSAEVIDMAALIRAVADSKVPLQALKVDQTFLNQMARSLKDSLDFPGVKLVKKQSMAAGRK